MRYFIGFLLSIGLIILLIILLFKGGGSKQAVPTTSKTLYSYASTDAEVSLLVDGPINAQSQHYQEKITVSRDQVVYEQIDGYNGGVKDMKHFDNSQAAYDNFLHALARAGFTLGDNDKALKDEKGYCSTGNRYIFEMVQNGDQLQRFWTTSCGKPKTYKGNTNLTLRLFRAQVPDYNDIKRPDNFSVSLF